MSTDVLDAPDAPLFVAPDRADKAVRKAAPDEPKPVPADPSAPFGYMKDPRTGEVRPRKTAGRQPKQAKSIAAPKARAANKPRIAADAPAELAPVVTPADHAAQVGSLIDGLWMVAGAIPATDAKVFGVDIGALAVRAKATATVMQQQRASLSQGLGKMADNVEFIGKGVEYLAKDGGPGWVIPAALMILPFVGAMGQLWSAPIEQIKPLADQQAAEFRHFCEAQAPAQVQVGAQLDAAPDRSATYPGEVSLPGMEVTP